MKKYLLIVLIILFSFLSFNESEGVINYLDPIEVSTNNLKAYLVDNGINNIKGFCSYDRCYQIKEDDIDKSIQNFKSIYDKYLPEDELLVINVKGYPITKIILE